MEEKSRLMTRRNTRRISRVLMGGGGIPLKVLLEAAKENNNNGRYYYLLFFFNILKNRIMLSLIQGGFSFSARYLKKKP